MVVPRASAPSATFLGLVALICFLTAADAPVAVLQVATADSGDQVVRFRILDSETGAPIAGATLNDRDKTGPLGTGETRVNAPYTVVVRASGYAPHIAQVHDPDGTEETIRLRRALTIGGRVLDARGSAVAGADVRIFEPGWLPPPAAPTAPISASRDLATVTSDAEGRWVCAEVPADLGGVHISMHHPNHASAFYSTAPASLEAHGTPEGRVLPISWTKLRSMQGESVLQDGLPVLGSVRDPEGKPVADAVVRLAGAGFLEEYRGELKTGPDGHFAFQNGISGQAWLVVQADGYVLHTSKLEISRSMPDIRIQMTRGRLLNGRVIDQTGRPVVGADVTSRTGMSFKTDEDGRFFWDSAPEEPFTVHVRADGYPESDELVEARAGLNLIQLRAFRQIRVTGKVVDSNTRQPIPEFQVLTSTRRPSLPGGWYPYRRAATGKGGSFTLTLRDSFPAIGSVVQPGDGKVVRYVVGIKIAAPGYLPDVSNAVAIENGDASLEVSLVRGEGISGTVTLPDGEPVSGARVILSGRSPVNMDGPGQVTVPSAETPETTTDEKGRFGFTPQRDMRAVLAVHEKGFGLLAGDKLASRATIVLAPWGRIEGTLRVGTRLVPNVSISLWSSSGAPVSLERRAQTDDEGRFVFTRVPPGQYDFRRMQRLGERASAQLALGSVEVHAGATHRVNLGGMGRPVVGRAVLAASGAAVRWTQGTLVLELPPPKSLQGPAGGPIRTPLWMSEKAETEEAKAYLRDRWRSRIPAGFAADGSFRIEDVPAGIYWLNVNVPGLPNNSFVREFVVPEMPGGRSNEPLDLGVITVK